MGDCFLHGNGGVNPLNYRVQAYSTEALLKADKPLENTIGVVTDVAIAGHCFNENEASNPDEGFVWFSVAQSSGAKFYALKKDSVPVFPKHSKQYVDGEWKEKHTEIFISGKWIPWTVYWWRGSDRCVEVSGDWGHGAFSAKTQSSANGNPPIWNANLATGGRVYTNLNGCDGCLSASNPVDLTNVNTIVFVGRMLVESSSKSDYCAFHVWKGETYGQQVNEEDGHIVASLLGLTVEQHANVTERYLDVSSLTGEHYIGFDIIDDSSTLSLDDLRMEAATIQEVTASDS